MENNRIGLDENFLSEGELYSRVSKMTDRELQEFRTTTEFQSFKSLKRIEKSSKRTEKNVAFFFYFFLFSVFATIFIRILLN